MMYKAERITRYWQSMSQANINFDHHILILFFFLTISNGLNLIPLYTLKTPPSYPCTLWIKPQHVPYREDDWPRSWIESWRVQLLVRVANVYANSLIVNVKCLLPQSRHWISYLILNTVKKAYPEEVQRESEPEILAKQSAKIEKTQVGNLKPVCLVSIDLFLIFSGLNQCCCYSWSIKSESGRDSCS